MCKVIINESCGRLNLKPLTYLWNRNQKELLNEMIENGIESILIKTASLGINSFHYIGLIPSKHLGKSIKELQEFFHETVKHNSM